MDANYTGNIISERRKALGLTQKALAEKLHVTDKAVSKWERGVNFPDLGLMENLAAALDTTPAVLLGLENADQDEIVKNMVQISAGHLEDARKHLRIAGWLTVAVAILLVMGFVRDEMYTLLGLLVPALIVGALYLLFQFGAIRKWNWADMLLFYGTVFPLIIFNLGYLVRDHGFPEPVESACIFICAVCAQWLFYRAMEETWAKALPVIGLALFSLWHLSVGSISKDVLFCTALCFAVWLLLRRLDKKAQPLPVLKIMTVTAVGLVLFCLLFTDSLVKAYVNLRHDHLIAYCKTALSDPKSVDTSHYGPWQVRVDRKNKMVEFMTGGSGFGSQTSYEGFYYSADDEHLPYQGTDLPVEVYEDTGWWTDGTDNHGTTYRFRENFYWFEAHF